MHLLLILACATTPAPETAAPAPETATPAPTPSEDSTEAPPEATWVELRRMPLGDHTVLFRGEDVPEGLNQAFGIREVVFLLSDGTSAPFRPAGSVQFSDWTFDIASPDQGHVLLVQDHYGPYHLVSISNLPPYLAGTAAPDHVVHQTRPAEEGAWVHQNAHWTSATEVAYEAGLSTLETFTYSLAD